MQERRNSISNVFELRLSSLNHRYGILGLICPATAERYKNNIHVTQRCIENVSVLWHVHTCSKLNCIRLNPWNRDNLAIHNITYSNDVQSSCNTYQIKQYTSNPLSTPHSYNARWSMYDVSTLSILKIIGRVWAWLYNAMDEILLSW